MTAMRAPGSTVLRQIENRMGIMNIEVETGWEPDAIRALAAEEGFAYDSGTTRFYRAPDHVIKSQARDRAQAVTTYPQTAAGTGEAGDSTDAHEAAAQSPTVPAVPTVTGTGGDPAPVPGLPIATVPVPHVVEVAPVPAPPQVAPTPTAAPAIPVVEVEALTSPPASTTVTDDAHLIALGLAHPDRLVSAAAGEARRAVDALAAVFAEAEHRTSALAEVERLERLLTAARTAAGLDVPPSHRVPRPKPQPVAGRATPAEIRAWAAGMRVPCPPRGIVPRHVVDLYLDAHEDVAS